MTYTIDDKTLALALSTHNKQNSYKCGQEDYNF